jgi:hypothetical protein
MYVDDMSLEEAQEFLKEALRERYTTPAYQLEQLEWDIEDLEGRVLDLGGTL